MSNKEIKIGDIVRYIGKEYDSEPKITPPVGTLGKVLRVLDAYDGNVYFIQWEKGSTSSDDCWYQPFRDIELVEDIVTGKTENGQIVREVDTDLSNEEIWEMLESKMRKNGLKKKMGALYCDNNLTNGYWVYTPNDVHNAIAIAYRSGYERAMKGRPFKIGEKKKKSGHWEPVDPNNLPKEGTKVKYSKECKNNIFVKLGQEGLVSYLGKELGMLYYDREAQSLYWVNFYGVEKCLDMWVEDEE